MGRIKAAAILITTFALALLTAATLVVLPQRLLFRGGESYRFYLGDTSVSCREVFADGDIAPLTRLTLNGVNGESAVYPSLDIDAFLDGVGGEIIFKEELSDSVNYYCKADLPYSVTLYGEEINLHICVKDGSVTVASPIIFGGY